MFKLDFSSNVFSQHFTAELLGPEELTANENKAASNFSSKRLKEFSTGRFCARKALSELNYAPTDILIGPNKQPLWPDGTVGSISHSGQLTGAVAGLSSHFLSIGLDIETTGKISADMWDMIYTPAEQQFLNAFRAEELPYYNTLLFSFKESFYKMQHPLTNTFLEFTDVEVNLLNNKFELRIIKDFDGKNRLPQLFLMHHLQEKNQVITFCYLINDNNLTNR